MARVRFWLIPFFIFYSSSTVSADLQLFKIVNLKKGEMVSLHAWPSNKSRVIARLKSQTPEIVFLNKSKKDDKQIWLKVRWQKQQGWMLKKYLEAITPDSKHQRKAIKSKDRQQPAVKKDSLKKQQNKGIQKKFEQAEPPELPPSKHQLDRYGQWYPSKAKTAGLIKTDYVPSASINPFRRSKLNCKGKRSEKWRINMNMGSKRMWVQLDEGRPYSAPISYSQWNPDSSRRMLIIAGEGSKRVRAALQLNRTCRRDFSRTRYTYSINAMVARQGVINGCCGDSTR